MYDPYRGNHGIAAQAVMILVQWQFEIRGHPTFDESLSDFLFDGLENGASSDSEKIFLILSPNLE